MLPLEAQKNTEYLGHGMVILVCWLLFQGTWIQFLAPTWRFTTIHNSSPRGSHSFLQALWAPGTQVVHNHTCRQNTHTHFFKLKIKT